MATAVNSWLRNNFTTSLFGCFALGFLGLFTDSTAFLLVLIFLQCVLLVVGLSGQWKQHKHNLANEKSKLARAAVHTTGKQK